MLTVIRPLLDDLKPQRHSSRVLYVFGGFWIFSALVRTGLLAATGFEWSGSVSWRKPIVFGLSIGLLLMTVGWILDRLPAEAIRAGLVDGYLLRLVPTIADGGTRALPDTARVDLALNTTRRFDDSSVLLDYSLR